ncbi:DUF3080 domain-containing protein [Vibrio pectenicida]|uniref:DUF3080 domain-containing protein n=1 Tax=Vibrio pectenicida TaxID=62763 RepID=UPI0020A410D7|nr:DUF3080 domain-containing protein [Vibrio pectenicida]
MRIQLICLSITMLTSCNFNRNHIEQTLQTYLSRIANVQERSTFVLPDDQSITLPSKQTLFIDIPRVSISLIDSYELRKCGLFSLIAERNSILGKVQDQFRNYDYQIKLNYGLNGCIQSPNLSESLRSQLIEIQAEKLSQLPNHFSNLLFSSDAMRRQLQSSHELSIQGPKESSIILEAIKQIDSAFSVSNNQKSLVVLSPLTPYQEVLDKQPILGMLSYTMLNTSLKLQIVTKQLKEHDDVILCKSNRDRTQFNYLRNVFNEFFIGKIQPYMAKVDSVYNDLNPYLDFTNTGHPKYHYPIREYHRVYRKAILDHVKYWQDLFKRCGTSPIQ